MKEQKTYYTCDVCKKKVEDVTEPDKWVNITIDLVGFTNGTTVTFLLCDDCCKMPIRSTIFRTWFDRLYVLKTMFATKLLRR